MGASVQCEANNCTEDEFNRCGRSSLLIECGGTGEKDEGFDALDSDAPDRTSKVRFVTDGEPRSLEKLNRRVDDKEKVDSSSVRSRPMVLQPRPQLLRPDELGPLGDESDGQISYFDREKEELDLMKGKVGPSPMSGTTYRFKSGAVYQGQWESCMRHGYGKMLWSDGVTYEGQWSENVASGRGRFQHIDGDQYIGEWSNNMANGMGVYYHDGCQTYLGQWRDDFQHGNGIESWTKGDWYEGQFSRSQKDGHGRYRWDGGCEYLGRWTNNAIGGYGICTAVDGRVFRGLWKETSMHGLGLCTFPDGTQCSGTYWLDKRDGFGIFKEADGGGSLIGYWSKSGSGVPCICKSPHA